jgi:D-glycero-D-manno-heptose 1,7-bisphosphate phosphatase
MRLASPPLQRETGARLRRAVFIDKDGTLVDDVPYNVDPALLRFRPGAFAALRRLAAAGYLLIVVSNQPGIALRRFDGPALDRLAQALTERLVAAGVRLAGFYACPHAPRRDAQARGCRCRKPAAGLFHQAARDHGLDLGRSWMVGDILDDIEAGWRAGCASVLLDVGNETEWRWSPIRVPDHRVKDLPAVAEAILSSPVSPRSHVLLRRPTVRRPAEAAARHRSAA